jgi:hypothetical protein
MTLGSLVVLFGYNPHEESFLFGAAIGANLVLIVWYTARHQSKNLGD